MLKGVRFLLVVLLAACSAACGNKATAPTETKYMNYSSVTSKGGIMGGAVQNAPLSLVTKDINSIMVSTLAGTVGSAGAVNGVGSVASFNLVTGITTDGSNLYVTDYGNHTIRKIDSSGNVTTIAGTPGVAGSNPALNTDQTLYSAFGNSAGGLGNAYFNSPSGITADGHRNLYVTDYGNNTIRRIALPFNNTSTVVTTIAGSPGVVGAVDADTGTDARFNRPIGITMDGNNLYVTDSVNLTIRKISLIPPYKVRTIAGSPGAGGSNPPVDATPVPGPDARFQYPARITTDGTNLYVTDFIKNTISMIDGVSYKVSTIAGTAGVTGSADGIGAAASFSNVNGITSDGTSLYVTDSNNHTVRRVVKLPSGKWSVTTIAGSPGVIGSNVFGSPASGGTARFKFPVGITTDGTSLYVTDSDNYTIRQIQ
jgi:hypothetical protein